MKVLVIGDFHIPGRASDIPKAILKEILREKLDLILCTGDFTHKWVLERLKGISRLVAVEGNMDYPDLSLPRAITVKIENFHVGLVHGNGVYPRGDEKKLAEVANKMGVDILVSGHTHASSLREVTVSGKRILLLDPGSATGCWGGGPASLVPSFAILEVKGNDVLVKLYTVINNKLLEKSHFFKKV